MKGATTQESKDHRLRYKTDPSFRRRVIANQRKYLKKNRNDAEFRRLQYLHKRIYKLRESCAMHQEKLEKRDRELLSLVRERAELQKKRERANLS